MTEKTENGPETPGRTSHVRFQGTVRHPGGHFEILAAYGIEWRRVESPDPGRVVHADAHQVVVVPHD